MEKYEVLWEQSLRNGWMTNIFRIKVGSQGFMANSTSAYLIKFDLSQTWKHLIGRA